MPVIVDAAPACWADLVFHVLAHVRATRHLAASLFDSVYVRYVEGHCGASSARTLARDAEVLGRVVTSHEGLASLQLLAWLHSTIDGARGCAELELTQLTSMQVDAPELLLPLSRMGPAVEVLRCAALLEEDCWSSLPSPPDEAWDLQERLDAVVAAAPRLARCRVRRVRSLRLRGRIRGSEIWVGHPGDALGVSVEHVAWQAAHEATVCEVAEAMETMGKAPSFACVEHVAVVLLADRSASAGMGEGHRVWLSHLGNAPSISSADLSVEERAVLQVCRRR